MIDTLGPGPGQRRYPRHRLQLLPQPGRWLASARGLLLADSRATVALDENGYDRCIYFPPSDVRTERLRPSATRTTCPFKGEAYYYAMLIDGRLRDVAWYYPRVYDELESVQGYIAFYPMHVDLHPDTGARLRADPTT